MGEEGRPGGKQKSGKKTSFLKQAELVEELEIVQLHRFPKGVRQVNGN